MKWILNRQKFLNEAKIRDLILPPQAKKVASKWGEKYLDYEEVTPTPHIKQGKWKLSEEDKLKVLGIFFMCNFETILNNLKKLAEDEKFVEALNSSIDYNLLQTNFTSDKVRRLIKVFENFDLANPTLDQVSLFNRSFFRNISINETKADTMIQKDESGRPVRDEEGNMLKVQKNPGDIIYSNNLVSLRTFIDSYKSCFPDFQPVNIFDNNLEDFISVNSVDENNYEIDFDILNKDIFLVINHDPKLILNMSISKFYSSCQHLYSGSYNSQVLSNVFDPNSIPAFLLFETPIYNQKELISDFLPLSRMVIRSIEKFDSSSEPVIFFDRSYPDRMSEGRINIFEYIVEKYSQNINEGNTGDVRHYYFAPDIDLDSSLDSPYMDRLSLRSGTLIGKNVKTLYLSRLSQSSVKISPEINLKELIIDTTSLPENFDKLKLNLDWIKFKYISLFNLDEFKNVNSKSLAFEKCKLTEEALTNISGLKPTRLLLQSCDLPEELNFEPLSNLEPLEELKLVYSLNTFEELKEIMKFVKTKKLSISSDLLQGKSKENQDFLNSLRRSMKVEIIGPKV